MKITAESLKERYQCMETPELVALRSEGGLTEVAMSVLDEELKARGVTDEMQAAIGGEIQSGKSQPEHLASLGSRLGAQLIDDLIGILLAAIFVFTSNNEALSLVGIAAFLGYILLSDALPNGQSIGKKALSIAVVDKNTNKPCTVSRSLFRNITLVILGFIDWVFIFGSQRQRIGDMLAGTVVVNMNAHLKK